MDTIQIGDREDKAVKKQVKLETENADMSTTLLKTSIYHQREQSQINLILHYL